MFQLNIIIIIIIIIITITTTTTTIITTTNFINDFIAIIIITSQSIVISTASIISKIIITYNKSKIGLKITSIYHKVRQSWRSQDQNNINFQKKGLKLINYGHLFYPPRIKQNKLWKFIKKYKIKSKNYIYFFSPEIYPPNNYKSLIF